MNPRDLSELKRRLNPDRRNPTVIRGCYVGGDGHIISTFSQPVFHLPQEENEKYMAIFKRILSGTQGQNTQEIEFSAAQVMEGAEHQLLCALRDSALTDDAAVEAYYQRVIAFIAASAGADAQSVAEQQEAANYLILLLHDGYEVPFRDTNGEVDHEQSSNVFHYILSAVCSVRQTKPALSYYAAESEFHNRMADWIVGAPELGFLFPAFTERSADLYHALYYTRDSGDVHDAFIQSVFGTDLPIPAKEQQETFQAILQDALAEECSLSVVQAVHETVRGLIQEQKADKTAEPLSFTKQAVKGMLESCGVSKERASVFEEQYGQAFGDTAAVPAVNMVTHKQFTVSTPSVSIRVDPEHSELIETRVIDGRYYILVLADGDVEVNGVNVKFRQGEEGHFKP
ncbi:MAG: DUF4317 domain-containing protein [Clostridia bacterium]